MVIELRAEELVALATAYEQGFDYPQPDGDAALFTITEVGLGDGDEYEFYLPNTLVIATMEEGDWRGRGGGLLIINLEIYMPGQTLRCFICPEENKKLQDLWN